MLVKRKSLHMSHLGATAAVQPVKRKLQKLTFANVPPAPVTNANRSYFIDYVSRADR